MVVERRAELVDRLGDRRDGERARPYRPIAQARGLLDATRAGAPLECLGLVAVSAADVATGESYEDLPLADQGTLALDRREDLGDEDVLGCRRHAHPGAGSATPASVNPRRRSRQASQSPHGRSPLR